MPDSASHSAPLPSEGSSVIFEEEWQVYRKVVDNNYLFHREAYGTLHQILRDEVSRPFSFLDIACGDASASSEALKGTTVARYHGIDLSDAALRLAAEALTALHCPVTLQRGDFLSGIDDVPGPFDVVWIGLSLHHLRLLDKLAFMRRIRALVAPGGLFLVYEDAMPDEWDRRDWLAGWDRQQTAWTTFTAAEWTRLGQHVHAADFPERDADWQQLGRDAGFSSVRERYRSPTDLFRLYSFAR